MFRLLKLISTVALPFAFALPLPAQTGSAGGAPSQPRPGVSSPVRPAAGTSRTAAPAQQAVPQTAAQQDEELDRILEEWYGQSRDVVKLHGEHSRFIYDFVNNIEKRSSGRFYYEAPDKGRIDLGPNREGQGETVRKINPDNNREIVLTIKPDTPERWISDGQQVLVIDDDQKMAQQIPIPPEAQGQNMMDGPLPFLFGMPPEKAKKRYQMRLLKADAKEIDLIVIPRWQQDAANYKWARVRIERSTMLPMAVQMMDPPGTRETVYTFPQISKNPQKALLERFTFWKEKDPFKPDLKGYQIQLAEVSAPAAQIPSVVGMDHAAAKTLLERSGYKVRLLQGTPAPREELKFRVQKQDPPAKEELEKGGQVSLTLYVAPVQQTSSEVPQALPSSQSAGQIRVPELRGTGWQDAKAQALKLGLVPKFTYGRTAQKSEDVYGVYEQSPAPGTLMKSGGIVVLTLYNKPVAAASAAPSSSTSSKADAR